MEERLKDILEEIEEQAALKKQSIFRSTLNQPNLVAISSANAVGQESGSSFSKFRVDLPRPILQAETLELVNANIPQCVPNIPDTACAFWYYRLSQYAGNVANSKNLYFVRLLPSYYKKEFIEGTYGYNQTFNSYQDVADQLALACQRDLAYDNITQQDGDEDESTYRLNYLPSEISITYDAGINKFRMTGTNATTQMAYKSYSAGTTYALNDVVVYLSSTYISLQAGNVGNTPPTSPTFWKKIYVDIVEAWDVDTPYREGQYVSYNNALYIANVDTIGGATPNSNANWGTTFPSDIFYRYLITGYGDPNVQLVQGTGRQQWNPYALFEAIEYVEYNGKYWKSLKQNKGFVPFTIADASIWDDTTSYLPGDLVLYSGVVYRCIANSLNDQPDISPIYWVSDPTLYQTWNATQKYSVGDIVSSGGVFYIATTSSVNQTPSLFSTYWSPNTFWSLWGDEKDVAIIGLNAISSQFDMMDTWDTGTQLLTQYPFPVGIPGQPFNPKPRRLLNSILGWTWNGLMTPSILAGIDTFVTAVSTSTTTTELFNRIRPVPQYSVRFTTTYPTLRDPVATASQVCTADGYCNLVYSSIISIYTGIVGGSTLNTQENTNLLAMGTMNCGNLGISFFSPFINNPLLVSGNDLYTIIIELQDEFGEPYVLTNNAVVSIVLKITYKKDLQK